jgi:hypothetical protein
VELLLRPSDWTREAVLSPSRLGSMDLYTVTSPLVALHLVGVHVVTRALEHLN